MSLDAMNKNPAAIGVGEKILKILKVIIKLF